MLLYFYLLQENEEQMLDLRLARERSVDKDKLYKAYLLVREYAIEVFPLSSAQVVATNYAQSFGFD